MLLKNSEIGYITIDEPKVVAIGNEEYQIIDAHTLSQLEKALVWEIKEAVFTCCECEWYLVVNMKIPENMALELDDTITFLAKM